MHSGKSVVVTGGANGIGRGIVERFLRDGASVVVADIDTAAADDLKGDQIIVRKTDVRDEESVDQAVNAAVERFGRLDVMVNNAGVIFVSPLVKTSMEQWQQILDINLTGVFLGCRAASRQMIAQGEGGVIINASSGGGRRGYPNFSHYCATKAAIAMLSQSLSGELAPHGIRVNCYAPGHITTPLWNDIVEGFSQRRGQSHEEIAEQFLESIPLGRFGTPEDVAGAVSWLCTDEAEYITGQCIAMNGGDLPWT